MSGQSVGEGEHTHYCEDCESELALMYDDRDFDETPIVCGHCGGNNTRLLQADTDHEGEMR